jgi:hypothetical protein
MGWFRNRTCLRGECGGRERGIEGVLVPPGGENLRGGGRGQRPADDEPEEPRPRGRDEPGFGDSHQLIDHRERVGGRALHGRENAARTVS